MVHTDTHTVIPDADETLYVVNHNGNDVYHYAEVTVRSDTGQPNQDVFKSEQAAYDKHGENLPARYQVLKTQTQEEITDQETDDVIQEAQFEWSIEPKDDTTTTTGIDTEIVDEVALKQTAYDKYDELNG